MFSSTGQNLASQPLGATSTWTSGTQYQTLSNLFGNDYVTDPYIAFNNNAAPQLICSSNGVGAWTVTMPASGWQFFPQGQPANPIASVVFINRIDQPAANVPTRSNGATVTVLNPLGSSIGLATITINSAQTTAVTLNFGGGLSTVPIFPNSSLAPPSVAALQLSSANLTALVRYINISQPNAGKCLHFRELYAFDNTWTNVALNKPTIMGSGGYTFAAYGDPVYFFTSLSSMGTDGVVDMDNLAGNMVNLPCDGTSWWQVDLGGVYALTRLVFWNRYPYITGNTPLGTTYGANAVGAVVTYLNANGNAIGSRTLTGDVVQSFPVVLVAPSVTPTSVSTPSMTPSTSMSAAKTLPFGTSPSTSPSQAASPSIAATPSLTPSPYSPYTSKIEISLTTANYLNFVELFAFNSAGQNVASDILGSTAAFVPSIYGTTVGVPYSSAGATQWPYYAIDMFTDPFLAAAANPPAGAMVGTSSSGTFTWQLTLSPRAGPQAISSIVFINRCDQTNLYLNLRINTTTPASLTLIGQNNTILSQRPVLGYSVSVFNFPNNAQTGPIFANSSLSTAPPQTAANLNSLIRYINITAAPGKCLYFRELYAFDGTVTNVALFKPTSQSNTSYNGGYLDPAGFTSFSSYGVDGVIDMDNLSGGNMVNLGCSGNAWWAVDLGAVYNISKIIYFNRELSCNAPRRWNPCVGMGPNGAGRREAKAHGRYALVLAVVDFSRYCRSLHLHAVCTVHSALAVDCCYAALAVRLLPNHAA